MPCAEPGCPYPVAKDDLCANHWNQHFSEPHQLQPVLRKTSSQDFYADPELDGRAKPRTPSSYKTFDKRTAKPKSMWGWLIELVTEQDEVTVICAEHGLKPGQRDANRIRSILNQNAATAQWRWSVTQNLDDNGPEAFTIRKMGGWDVQNGSDGHVEVVKTPLAPKPAKPEAPKTSTAQEHPLTAAARCVGASELRTELEALLAKFEKDRDAAAERLGKLTQMVEAIQICLDLI